MVHFRSFMLRSERYRSIQTEERAVAAEYLHHKKIILLEQLPHLHGNYDFFFILFFRLFIEYHVR